MYAVHTSEFKKNSTVCLQSACMGHRINSDYFLLQLELDNFLNRDAACLLSGTNWMFNYVFIFGPCTWLFRFHNQDGVCWLRGTNWNFNYNSFCDLSMAQAVSFRSYTVEARFQSQVSSCEICGVWSGNGSGSSLSTWVFVVSIILPIPQTHLHLDSFVRMTKGESSEYSNDQYILQ